MLRGLSLAMIGALTAPVLASPRSDPTAGRAVFTGATLPDATSIDLDPAALGLGTYNVLYVAATTLIDRFQIARRFQDIDTGALSPGPTMRDVELGPGGMIAGIIHFSNDRGTLGLALHSEPTELFFGGHEAARYYTLGGSDRTYSGSVAGSVKITNELLFGLSLDAQKRYVHLHYARDTALAAGPAGLAADCGGSPCGVENPLASERFDVNVRTNLFSASDALVVNVGLLYQIAKATWIGVAYHAPPGLDIQNELDGAMDVRLPARDGGALIHGAATVYISEPASVDAELRTRLPADLDLHVGFRWSDLSRFQSYDVRGYGSTFPPNGVPEWNELARGFHDPFAVWAGVEQVELRESDWYRFGARVGFETSSLDDDRTSPMTISPASATFDVGVQLRLSPDIVVQAAYGLQYFPTVHVTQSAFDPRFGLVCAASGYDYSTPECEATRLGYAIPTAAGDYDRMEHSLRLGIRYEFH